MSLFFLNEWGDWQVVPYKPNRALSSDDTMNAMCPRPAKGSQNSSAPLHYAVFVDEHRMRVCIYVCLYVYACVCVFVS